MKSLLLSCIILTHSTAPCAAQDDTVLAARRAFWEKQLATNPFRFSKTPDQIGHALSRFKGDCEFHVVREPNSNSHRVTFKLVRSKREILSVRGHLGTSILTHDQKLYIAHNAIGTTGCYVEAYDMNDGKFLWKTPDLTHFEGFGHSAYGNQAYMGFSRTRQAENTTDYDVIVLRGREWFGDYKAVLDRATGELLAHRIYRRNFAHFDP